MSWDDGKHTKVKRVQLTFDDVINSIQVDYDGTGLQSQPRGPVGSKSDGFTLSPDEYITDMTGYYKTTISGEVITALTFTTNKKTYGPYGNKTRNYFSANAPKDTQIAGFLGTSENALNSIDVHFAPIPPPCSTTGTTEGSGGTSGTGGTTGGTTGGGATGGTTGGGATGGTTGGGASSGSSTQKVEVQGGKGGNKWDDGGDHDGVTKIYVAAGGLGIEQIKFDYLKNGQLKEGPVHGVKGRGLTSMIEINHPNEYLVSVNGWYDSTNIIQGIQFKTNTKTSEYFGYEFGGDGTQFSLEVKDKKIVGFHGFADSRLNSIGAYFAPISGLTPLKPAKKLKAIGGDEGALWDDGVFDGVRKIHVGQGNDGVSFVTIEYDKGSQTVLGDGHGKKSMLGVETFEIEYPSEYITEMGVYYDKVLIEKNGMTLVTSLIFKTNKRTSPPFGMTGGEYFEFKEEGHKIVGFHGKASDYVNQIGVYVVPITN